MAHSDIKYDKVSIDDQQESGNPDPISMVKSFFGSSAAQRTPAPAPGGSDDGAAARRGGRESAGETELKALATPGAFVGENLSSDERARANQMQAYVAAKLAKMTPEERAAFQKKQELMKQAMLARMNDEVPDELELSAARGPGGGGGPVESPEAVRDREILFAIRSGQPDLLDKVLEAHKLSPNASARAPGDEEAHPILHWAALNDQKEVLEYLVRKRVDLDQRNPRGEVALHWAALNGNLRAVHLLVDSGCDRMASDARGYSAMHHAAQFGRTIVLACLLRRGLNIDVRDNNGRTPLHWAAYKGEDLSAQWLIEHGADVAAEDFEQCLPIHWAALQGLNSMAAVLVKHGSLPHLGKKDRTGGTAADLAREKQTRYGKDSFQFRAYKKVADYLEACAAKKADVSPFNRRTPHPTWFAWPVLAPIGFWQYYTVVFPATNFHTLLTLLFWVFYWGEWAAWIMLQVKDPGVYVFRNSVSPRGGKGGGSADAKGETRIMIGGPDDDETVSGVNPNVADARKYRELYHEVLDNGLLVPVCTSCEIVKPLRSKHDRFTDVCVARFDHFCPFMGVAVGANNYREFFFAMFNAMICMWVWIYLVILYTLSYNKAQGFWSNFWQLLWWEMFAWLYFPIALYSMLMVGQHMLFIKRNITTNEVINRYRYQYLANKQNPFDRGTLTNVMEFFGLQDQVAVDVRAYYSYFFEGHSEQVERNNNMLRAGINPAAVQAAADSHEGHGHSHGGGGGHGHSHGSRRK